jgi:hypothetical protein
VSVSVAPSTTFNLLVDFDRAEILNMKEDEGCLERTVTSFEIHFITKFWLISFQCTERFMARAVRASRPLGRFGNVALYWKVPELSQRARNYGEVFPDRLTRFQHSSGSPDRHVVDIGAPPDSSSWRHKLHHDAESAFWLLVWWVVNAAPVGCTSKIPIGLWGPLIDTTSDTRPLEISRTSLDPAYAPLSELLASSRTRSPLGN